MLNIIKENIVQDPNTTPSTDATQPAEPTPVVPPVPAGTTFTQTQAGSQPFTSSATSGVNAQAMAVPGAKNHLVAVLLSIFVGTFGVDRFYLGHIGLGVAKLLLSWLTLGVWWLIDVILISTRKVKNVTWDD